MLYVTISVYHKLW